MFKNILLLFFSLLFLACSKEIIQQKLTVDVTPIRGGAVSPLTNAFEKGTIVSLVATPAPEYIFKQWQGGVSGTNNPTSITMDTDKQVTGVFEKRQYPLTLTIEGNGTVKEEISAVAPQSLYPHNTLVRITAQPDLNNVFVGWSGDLISPANPFEVVVDKPVNLKATFKPLVFPGYKVQPFTKSDEPNYWRDCGVMWDVIGDKFFKKPNGTTGSCFFPQVIAGDFNKDGWIDIYNPGTGSFNGKVVDNNQWLIWNPTLKTYENKNLLNNNLTSFGGNPRRTISVDLNKDGYTDAIILDHGDDVLPNAPLQPIRIVLSDGRGGYDLKEISVTPSLMYNHGGDIGDLNNDGNFDLVVATGSIVYITWGIPNYPYFGTNITMFNIWDNNNSFPEAAGGVNNITIADVNNDGWNDIIEGSNENSKTIETTLPFDLQNRVLINQGNGIFNKNGLKLLQPYFSTPVANSTAATNHDMRAFDFNGDGLKDILVAGSVAYDNYYFVLHIQQKDGSFKIGEDKILYSNNVIRKVGKSPGFWKPWLVLYDFNGDGRKDFSYIDSENFSKTLTTKSVFIRLTDVFIEQDFYQYDEYAKSIKP
jgi:hypothetical protein